MGFNSAFKGLIGNELPAVGGKSYAATSKWNITVGCTYKSRFCKKEMIHISTQNILGGGL